MAAQKNDRKMPRHLASVPSNRAARGEVTRSRRKSQRQNGEPGAKSKKGLPPQELKSKKVQPGTFSEHEMLDHLTTRYGVVQHVCHYVVEQEKSFFGFSSVFHTSGYFVFPRWMCKYIKKMRENKG